MYTVQYDLVEQRGGRGGREEIISHTEELTGREERRAPG